MKKLILVISIVLLSVKISAQENFRFGIKGGVNFSSLNNINYNGYKKIKTGINFGLLAEISLNDKFSIQPEILYSTQGVKTDLNLNAIAYPGPGPIYQPYTEKGKYIFNYIQIPILAKVYLIKKLSFEIGPSFNFLTKSEQKSKSQTYRNIGKDFEFSGTLGFSYEISKKLFVSYRFLKGFSNAFHYDPPNFENAKNYGYQLGFGLLL
ncbi:porin family protein [Yeosuana marina]|uniref:porin family protein n=1 Tax=Yeosuana marina TaxID=1565536 RepID=UPI001424046E|nr:porin family protein [Yeosuana marina]